MINPNNLTYLEAMEIPVWVSRDRVLESKKLPNSAKNEEHQNQSSAKTIISELEKNPKITNSNLEKPTKEVRVKETNIDAKDAGNYLGETDSHIVFAQGNLEADWFVIGESPERFNSITNQPYPGDSGVLLGNMLKAVGVDFARKDAYLVNIIQKPNHKKRSEEDNRLLSDLVFTQIGNASPKIVLLLGQLSAQTFLQSDEPLVRLRGKTHTITGLNSSVIVSYYPDYLINKPSDKSKAWEDLKLAMQAIDN